MWLAAYSVQKYLCIYLISIDETSILGGIKDSKTLKCIGYIFATFIPNLIQFSLIFRHVILLTISVVISYLNVKKIVEH